jgi:hypothetical protein
MTYVVLLGHQVVAGPFATAAEAVKAREALIKANFVTLTARVDPY